MNRGLWGWGSSLFLVPCSSFLVLGIWFLVPCSLFLRGGGRDESMKDEL